MTLTALRRMVAAGNVVAVLVAGGAGWWFADAGVEARDRDEWRKLFPQNTDADSRLDTDTTLPWDRYSSAAAWYQGQKKVEKPVDRDDTPKPPPIPPLKQRYKLNMVMVSGGGDLLSSRAILQEKKPGGVVFSVQVGRYIPKVPGLPSSGDSEWRLNDVSTTTATFLDWRSDDEVTLEFEAGATGGLPTGGSATGGFTPQAPREVTQEMPVQAVLESFKETTLDDGTVVEDHVWQVAEEEVEWFGSFADDELKSLATVNATDDQGRPAGFTIKAVGPGTRAAQYGLEAEDRVISVNSVPVRTKEHAIEVGKSQYDEGTSAFKIQIDRAGKIVNYHFKAKRPKKGNKRREP